MTDSFADAKQQVKDAAKDASTECFLVNGNRDIEKVCNGKEHKGCGRTERHNSGAQL